MSTLSKKTLTSWLHNLAQEQILIAPKDVSGVLLYHPVQNGYEIVWDYSRPLMSIKDVLFPATERLLTIQKIGPDIKLEEEHPMGQQVLFGVRPCDASGLLALDALFLRSEPVDTSYAQRRDNTTIIGMACQEMADTCFCTSTGGAPDDPTGMDIMVYPFARGYQIQVLTEKGKRIVDGLDILRDRLNTKTIPTSKKISIPVHNSWPEQFENALWEEVSERCISCRICAYVCPTCRCFDIRDEPLQTDDGINQYERIRCWDSCAGKVYRKIAGGHNPRGEKGERLRNRFMCKFFYYQEQYGPTACTGCGRCIDACPVNIDITEILSDLVVQNI